MLECTSSVRTVGCASQWIVLQMSATEAGGSGNDASCGCALSGASVLWSVDHAEPPAGAWLYAIGRQSAQNAAENGHHGDLSEAEHQQLGSGEVHPSLPASGS